VTSAFNAASNDAEEGGTVQLVFAPTRTESANRLDAGTGADAVTDLVAGGKDRSKGRRRASMAEYIAVSSSASTSVFPRVSDMEEAWQIEFDVDRTVPGGPLAALNQMSTLHVHRDLLRRLFLSALSLTYPEFRQRLMKLSRRLRRAYLRADGHRLELPVEGLGPREVANVLRTVREDVGEGAWRTWRLPPALVFPAWLVAPSSDARDEFLWSHTPSGSNAKPTCGWDLPFPLSRVEADSGLAVIALYLVPGLDTHVRMVEEDAAYVKGIVNEQKRSWRTAKDVVNWMQVHRFSERGVQISETDVASWMTPANRA